MRFLGKSAEENTPHPKLRQVEFFPAEISGQRVICIKDPLNLSGKVLFVPYPLFYMISLFDGRHSIVDVQAEFMRRFGELLYREKIEALLGQLEDHFLLESDRFRGAERKLVEDFQKAPFRPLNLAGGAYEKDPAKLLHSIQETLRELDRADPPAERERLETLTGVIAPHIDYSRGGSCYARAHRAIRNGSKSDLVLILGTAHAPTRHPYAVTRKDFETPWGLVETDRGFLNELQGACPYPLLEDEFVHRGEHSIELQLVFLRALWDKDPPLRIIPVLCGSFHEAIAKNQSPSEVAEIESFIQSLKQILSHREGRVLVLASADLAHVGVRFGDAEAPNRFTLETLEEEDGRLLGYAERMDAEGFYEVLRREKDRRRICGLSSIYTLLRIVNARQARILQYGQAMDDGTQSVVTFASLGFFS